MGEVADQLLVCSTTISMTYRSSDYSATSWIDHLLCTTSMLNIVKINVLEECD